MPSRHPSIWAGFERHARTGAAVGPIADRLGISGKTVSNLVSVILQRLGVPDRAEAARVARAAQD
ncbi:LuxR C-terminal-related transcriptional regulator [Agromyces neolithicus]|uniref:LuxR C-terminal-related transcriptional regulator n=1 Tax=Agromyces neolithicus TaxID=269420 RepID=UPI0031D4044A